MENVQTTLGAEQLSRISDSLYARILADDELSPFFEGRDVAELVRRQSLFLAHLIDDTEGVDLRRAHAPLLRLGLGHDHFDRMLEHVGDALAEHAVSTPIADSLMTRLEATRRDVLGETHCQFNPPPKRREKPMFSRIAALLYAVVSYSLGMASLVYMALWLVTDLVPNPLDGPASGSMATGLLINSLLILGFAVQHSVMARPWFKERLVRIIPPTIERSTYLVATTIALMTVMFLWQPLGITVWKLEGAAASLMLGVYAIGWMLLVSSTFLINHFDLFGLRQTWMNLRGHDYRQLPFTVRGYYHFVRHPLYLGFMVLLWSAPHMTISHLAFAVAMTAYIVIAVRWEERDLSRMLPEYESYQSQVPALIPTGRTYQG